MLIILLSFPESAARLFSHDCFGHYVMESGNYLPDFPVNGKAINYRLPLSFKIRAELSGCQVS